MKIGVYVLLSLKDKRTYVGSTIDLERRLLEHNSGKVRATECRLPVKLIYFEECGNVFCARKLEHYYKSCSGRKKLKIILLNLI